MRLFNFRLFPLFVPHVFGTPPYTKTTFGDPHGPFSGPSGHFSFFLQERCFAFFPPTFSKRSFPLVFLGRKKFLGTLAPTGCGGLFIWSRQFHPTTRFFPYHVGASPFFLTYYLIPRGDHLSPPPPQFGCLFLTGLGRFRTFLCGLLVFSLFDSAVHLIDPHFFCNEN